jgi:hypothetical protein
VRLTHVLRAIAVLVGVALIGFVTYATPIIWRQPETRWAVLIAWPLAIGAIRLLRVGITGNNEGLHRLDARLAQLREHQESYHRGDGR